MTTDYRLVNITFNRRQVYQENGSTDSITFLNRRESLLGQILLLSQTQIITTFPTVKDFPTSWLSCLPHRIILTFLATSNRQIHKLLFATNHASRQPCLAIKPAHMQITCAYNPSPVHLKATKNTKIPQRKFSICLSSFSQL